MLISISFDFLPPTDAMNPQLNSPLCQLPSELLIQIASYIFSEFKLKYARDTHIWRPLESKPHLPSLLRTCHRLRQTLLPVLSSSTTALEVVRSYLTYGNPHPLDHTTSMDFHINIPPLFRDSVCDLFIPKEHMHIPHFSLFINLRRIHMWLKPALQPQPFFLSTHAVTDDWLLDIFEKELQCQELSPNEFSRRTRGRMPSFEAMSSSNLWLRQLYMSPERVAAGIHLIISQHFYVRFASHRRPPGYQVVSLPSSNWPVCVTINMGTLILSLR